MDKPYLFCTQLGLCNVYPVFIENGNKTCQLRTMVCPGKEPGPAVVETPGSGYSSGESQRGWTESRNNWSQYAAMTKCLAQSSRGRNRDRAVQRQEGRKLWSGLSFSLQFGTWVQKRVHPLRWESFVLFAPIYLRRNQATLWGEVKLFYYKCRFGSSSEASWRRSFLSFCMLIQKSHGNVGFLWNRPTYSLVSSFNVRGLERGEELFLLTNENQMSPSLPGMPGSR